MARQATSRGRKPTRVVCLCVCVQLTLLRQRGWLVGLRRGESRDCEGRKSPGDCQPLSQQGGSATCRKDRWMCDGSIHSLKKLQQETGSKARFVALVRRVKALTFEISAGNAQITSRERSIKARFVAKTRHPEKLEGCTMGHVTQTRNFSKNAQHVSRER